MLASCAIAATLAAAPPAAAAAPSALAKLTITGTKVLSKRRVRRVVGRPPAEVEERAVWAIAAAGRVGHYYQRRGFLYVRVWHIVDPAGDVRLHIDEGVMSRIELARQNNAVKRFLARFDLHLPHGVFHEPSVRAGLEQLRVRQGLGRLRWEVFELPEPYPNPLGLPIKRRAMRLLVVPSAGKRRSGVSAGASVGARYDLSVHASHWAPDLLVDGDQLGARLEIALPWRRMLFDEEPQFAWVNGEARLGYRLPRLGGAMVRPQLEFVGGAGYASRADLGLAEALEPHVTGLLGVEIPLSHAVRLLPRAGVSWRAHVGVERVEGWTEPTPETEGLLRAELRLDLSAVDYDARREDLRSELRLTARATIADGWETLVATSLWGRLVGRVGHHVFVLGGRAAALFGDVRFWDEALLGSKWQRVYFDNAYWVRQLGQVEVAYRLPIIDERFQLGVFHDLSVFGDRTREDAPVAWANAFGPSVHLLLFHFLAIDLYQGFGFSPRGFDIKLSFFLKTVY